MSQYRFLVRSFVTDCKLSEMKKRLSVYTNARLSLLKVNYPNGNTHELELPCESTINTSLIVKITLEEAKIYFMMNEFETAVGLLSECIIKEPENHKLLSLRGICLAHMSNFRKALNDINEALMISPDYLPALVNKIIVLVDGYKQVKQARDIVNTAFKIYPTSLRVRGYAKSLGVTLPMNEADKRIPSILGSVNSHNKHSSDTIVLLLDTGSKGDNDNTGDTYTSENESDDSVLNLWEEQSKKSHDKGGYIIHVCGNISDEDLVEIIDLYIEMVQPYESRDRFSFILEKIEHILDLYPNHWPSLICRGNIRKYLGMIKEALSDYKRCLDIKECRREDVLFSAATCEFILGNYTDCILLLDHITTNNPNFISSKNLRGECNLKLGNYAESVKDFTFIIDYFSNHKTDLLTIDRNKQCLARALSRRGYSIHRCDIDPGLGFSNERERFELSKNDFERSLKIIPNDTDVLNCIAEIHMHNNDHTLSLRYYSESLKCDPENVVALIGIGCLCKLRRLYECAIKIFKKVIKENDKCVGAYYHLIVTYMDMSDNKYALDVIDKLLIFHTSDNLECFRQTIQKVILDDSETEP